ncbi:MAG: amidohydrolase family protein [Pontibacterium sp.]
MSVFDERKIDCHNHICDPSRFPYQPNTPYEPKGAELTHANMFLQLLDVYGGSHALIVGLNSGYGENDNRALLDAIARSNGRFKGMAVVSTDCSRATLEELKAKGVVGVTFNAAYYGVDHYADVDALLGYLADLELIAQVQTTGDQLSELMPVFAQHDVPLVLDHCGRPDLSQGVNGKDFQAVLALANNPNAYIKVSGFAKFSQQGFPYTDCDPYVEKIKAAFGVNRCLWGSDWPFLQAPERIDYGMLLTIAARHFPDKHEREHYFWKNAARLYGFEA